MFEIGQQVVCVNDDWSYCPTRDLFSELPTLRGVYTISRIAEQYGWLWLVFWELTNPHPQWKDWEGCFRASHFRPVRKTSIEDLKKLCVDPPKAPVKPVRVREDA